MSPGNLVGPDTGVLATVVQDDPMQVLFSVTQREMLEARDSEVTGKVRARVRLANGSLYSEKGRIDFLDVQVNPRTDGQTVRAMFPNPDDILTSGQTVRVIIEEKGGDKVVVIPQSAIAIDQTGPYVFVVGEDNKVEQRRLQPRHRPRGARGRRGRREAGRAGRRSGAAAHPSGDDRSASAGVVAGRLTKRQRAAMISSVFIHRPRLAIVISIVISIAGVIALGALPVAQFPDIVPPQVQVSTIYPGASAAAVEESVAQVIEAQVNGVDRMIYMKSTSGGDGSYTLNVTFEVGSDPDLNTVNVTNRVNQALAQLPPEVQRNGVTTRKQSTSLLQVVAIYSPKGTRDALFLSNYAKINMVDTLKRVPGVGDASQWGDLEYSMRIWLNLDRMASLDITSEDVINAINSQNTQAAVGRVGAAPLVPEVEFQLNISTQGRLTTVEEFNNIIVRATPDGGVVRIKDIARAELGSKSAD